MYELVNIKALFFTSLDKGENSPNIMSEKEFKIDNMRKFFLVYALNSEMFMYKRSKIKKKYLQIVISKRNA